jgi:hypothetical protein
MIAAVDARYTGKFAIKVFSTSFANASSDDWAVPQNNTLDRDASSKAASVTAAEGFASYVT